MLQFAVLLECAFALVRSVTLLHLASVCIKTVSFPRVMRERILAFESGAAEKAGVLYFVSFSHMRLETMRSAERACA
jgi:hypothetical protein